MTKWAGRFADGFICTSGKGRALYAETLLPNLAAGRESEGRPESAVERMIDAEMLLRPAATHREIVLLEITRHQRLSQ